MFEYRNTKTKHKSIILEDQLSPFTMEGGQEERFTWFLSLLEFSPLNSI